jgi:hypothetical protein
MRTRTRHRTRRRCVPGRGTGPGRSMRTKVRIRSVPRLGPLPWCPRAALGCRFSGVRPCPVRGRGAPPLGRCGASEALWCSARAQARPRNRRQPNTSPRGRTRASLRGCDPVEGRNTVGPISSRTGRRIDAADAAAVESATLPMPAAGCGRPSRPRTSIPRMTSTDSLDRRATTLAIRAGSFPARRSPARSRRGHRARARSRIHCPARSRPASRRAAATTTGDPGAGTDVGLDPGPDATPERSSTRRAEVPATGWWRSRSLEPILALLAEPPRSFRRRYTLRGGGTRERLRSRGRALQNHRRFVSNRYSRARERARNEGRPPRGGRPRGASWPLGQKFSDTLSRRVSSGLRLSSCDCVSPCWYCCCDDPA